MWPLGDVRKGGPLLGDRLQAEPRMSVQLGMQLMQWITAVLWMVDAAGGLRHIIHGAADNIGSEEASLSSCS